MRKSSGWLGVFGLLVAGFSGPFATGADVGVKYPHVAEFFRGLDAGEATTVVFFGGSITYGAFDEPETAKNETHSWRALVTQQLRARGGAGKLTAVDAAIGSTGSELGVFRMDRDVLPHRPDLVFVEFAVNGGGVEAMEGIVRKLRRQEPAPAIVIVVVGTGREGSIQLPAERDDHLRLARHYGIPGIDVAGLTRTMIESNEAQLTDFFPGEDRTHPKENGHRLYAGIILRELSAAAAAIGDAVPHPPPLTSNRFESARMVELSRLAAASDWTVTSPNPRGRWFDQTPARWLDSVVRPTKAGALLPAGKFQCSGVGLYFESTAGGGTMRILTEGRAVLEVDTAFAAADAGRAVVRHGFSFLGATAERELALHADVGERSAAGYLLITP